MSGELLTSHQTMMCQLLCLESVGYWGTSPHGMCAVNAIAQHFLQFSACKIHQQAGLEEERQAEVRHQAVQYLCNDSFAALFERSAVNASSQREGVHAAWMQQHSQANTVPLAHLFAAVAEKVKVWVGNWFCKATACPSSWALTSLS